MTDSKPDTANAKDVAEQATRWFSRLRSREVSELEHRQFTAWYAASATHRQAYDDIANFWQDDSLAAALNAIPLSSANERTGLKFSFVKPLLAVAACLAVTLIIYRPELNCLRADYCSGIGERRTVELADRSRITLNSGAAVAVDFRDSERLVRLLQGEAFFDVQRNPDRPFVVDSSHCRTRVLGTRFIVRDDGHSDTVSVASGSVEVGRGRQTEAVLKANDSITVGTGTKSDIHRLAPSSIGTWMKGSISFDNATLTEVIAEFSRYRRGSIVIKEEALLSLRVSGRFDITDTNKALEALQQTLPIRIYKLTPWLLIISQRSSG